MKFLLWVILYSILFSKEYKKQNKQKEKQNSKPFALCRYFPVHKFVISLAILSAFIFNISPALSFCSAVSACRLSDIETEHNKVIEKAINDYFDRTKIVYSFSEKDYKTINYNDLFIYNTIV